MELTRALSSLGLSDKEARVYVALLQAQPATAYEAAVRSQLKKPTAYVVLEELVARGIAEREATGKKTLYRALPPRELFERQQRELAGAREAALPELLSLSAEPEQLRARRYEGRDGAKRVQAIMKAAGGEVFERIESAPGKSDLRLAVRGSRVLIAEGEEQAVVIEHARTAEMIRKLIENRIE